MTPMEITLLILGVVIFLASFFVKDKEKAKTEDDLEIERIEIKRLIDKELDGITLRVNEATDGTIEYAMEKADPSREPIHSIKRVNCAKKRFNLSILLDVDNFLIIVDIKFYFSS